ncbi:MAG: Polysaccharide biosynthesis/export protein [Smithella sp. PtaU1.Bin162]|nr:MAG: Polysaccharide biosynthesis/export protein [Smithella sp. PtaU1.Bin162]
MRVYTRDFVLIAAMACMISGLLTACAPRYKPLPAGTVQEIGGPSSTAVVTKESVKVSGKKPDTLSTPDYLIGPGDILLIYVYGHPDMTLPVGNNTTAKGSRVDSSGTIQLPLIGSIEVGGFTLQQARDRIQNAFQVYLREPSVVVEMVEFKSHPLYLLGQFKMPGTHYMDRPLTLLQGIALGNGLDATANLRGARLLRGKKIAPVDIYALLHEGDQHQNVWLASGDTIYVPDSSLQNVFVFGAVKNPGTIPMKTGQLYLHQAVAAAGGLRDNSYDRNTRIIRSLSPTRGELIVVDLDKILAGEARPFPLMDGDIVYVPKTALANWNDAISEILPTLQAISAILNPFVQIKYLSD